MHLSHQVSSGHSINDWECTLWDLCIIAPCGPQISYVCCIQTVSKDQPATVAHDPANGMVPLESVSPTAPAAALPAATKAAKSSSSSKAEKADAFPGFAPVMPKAGASEGRQLTLAKSAPNQPADTLRAALRPPVLSLEPQLKGTRRFLAYAAYLAPPVQVWSSKYDAAFLLDHECDESLRKAASQACSCTCKCGSVLQSQLMEFFFCNA